jgi:sugar/nucleoside kinase (ribokinase family)
MKKPRILVIGSFMMDLVVRTPRAPQEGETVIGTSFNRFPGGKGANQAVAAARIKSISVCKIPRLDELSVLG